MGGSKLGKRYEEGKGEKRENGWGKSITGLERKGGKIKGKNRGIDTPIDPD